MQVNMRKEQRHIARAEYVICWEIHPGEQKSIEVQGVDISPSGLRFKSTVDLQPGTVLFIQSSERELEGYCTVRNCIGREGLYFIGVELRPDAKNLGLSADDKEINYYEFLQISPRAEPATIHRIYRFLATRFHPDNPDTGDPEKFVLLRRAFETLSDPERRREYDAARKDREAQPSPVFESIDFLDGVEGELNRRMAVLSILYNRRRTDPNNPGVSVFVLEKRMGFPREYLDFTMWYLRSKKYVSFEDNSQLVLTAAGVDFVEANYTMIPALNKMLLLKEGVEPAAGSRATTPENLKVAEFLIEAGGRAHPSAKPNGHCGTLPPGTAPTI